MEVREIRTEDKDMTRRAIEAAKLLLGRELVIQSDADFTTPGKRTVRVVHHKKNGCRAGPHIRWYVSGKAFRSLPLTADNVSLSASWKQPELVTGNGANQLALL